MEASAYFDSLISQGYSSEQAKKYTLQYYPDFETTQPETNPIHISESTPPPIPLPTPNLGSWTDSFYQNVNRKGRPQRAAL